MVKSKEYEDDMEKKNKRRSESDKVNEKKRAMNELSCQAGTTAKQYEDNVYSLKNRAMQQ